MRLSYLEDYDSKIPAIQLLCALGWRYLGRDEAVALRDNRLDRTVLTGILRPWLTENNHIEVKGETHLFTDSNIEEAIRRLLDEPYDGLVRTNEKLYHLITLGTSLDQAIEGDRKGRSLHYLEWDLRHADKNVYHVTDEFVVERSRSHEKARPDLVLFVNGIPFVVIECKRRDKDTLVGKRQIDAAIEQQLRNQRNDYTPHLFQYVQLLFATSVNDIRYGTVGTDKKFWSVWKEEGLHDNATLEVANTPLPQNVQERLFAPSEGQDSKPYEEARQYFTELWQEGERLPTEQDKTLWAMLRPKRLLDLVYGYMVFDAGVRKVARYQQYFAVKRTMERVVPLREGQRQGGVIWHTTGSGKSLTMVMLAKALALNPAVANPRVIIVTDRVDLDDQIWRTFEACGKSAKKATTGENLFRLIKEGKVSVITTIINKFQTVKGKYGVRDENPNIFVLVDESHRTNYGTIAAQMRRVFPNACYLGFTGTPLLKKEKSTARKFGGFIHSYTMREAVEDGTITPLLYEGRMVPLEQNKEGMQKWFDRITKDLSDAQKADLKRKMVSREAIHKASQRLQMIAYDVSTHYNKNWRGTGYKAQLAADSRASAIFYRSFLKDFGISEPVVNAFWKEMMTRFGSEERYVKDILASFSREDGVEILIVVDKLLTGFDEPRNTVLYIDKSLKEHSILQAIARVNRIYPGKEFGYIVDYRGILGQLNEAMNTYDALRDFDPDDVDLTGAVIDTKEEVAKLPQRHSDLWTVFKEVPNKKDNEALEQYLAPDDKREEFYSSLREFQKVLAVALSTEQFYEDAPSKRIQTYKNDLKFFRSLRISIQQRYSETIDYSQYEKQIRKVMDDHIKAPDVKVITDLVNIFDVEAFNLEVERRVGKAAQADTIASRLKKTIHEKIEEDPVFYRKFADLIQQAIDDYRQKRIDDAEYLKRVKNYLQTVRQGHESDLPEELTKYSEAPAYFGVVKEALANYGNADADMKSLPAKMAIDIESVIGKRKIRDWVTMEDVIKDMENDIDDYLFDIKDEHKLPISMDDMDIIIERCITIAKKLSGA